LREALAAADHDFVRAEPRKAAGKPRPRPGLKRSAKSKPGIFKGRISTLVAALACAGIIGGIVVNALVLQKTRHPAPLFAHRPQHQAPAEKPAPAAIPLPAAPPKPSPAVPQIPLNNPQAAKPEETPGAHPVPPETVPAAPGAAALSDPITQYLKAGAHPAEPARKAELLAERALPKQERPMAGVKPQKEVAAPKPDKDIEEAQRRLIKLGFVLEADGRMGEATRKAIQQYERDHKLAVDGEVSGLLLRQFAKEAGGRPAQ